MRQNKFATRLYRILLYLYPSDFRQANGEAMSCVFNESLSDAVGQSGTAGVLKVWLHSLTDLATAALAEWAARFMIMFGIEQRTSLGASIALHTVILFSLIWMGVSAGGLHPRPSTIPVCGKVKGAHPSPAPRSATTISSRVPLSDR